MHTYTQQRKHLSGAPQQQRFASCWMADRRSLLTFSNLPVSTQFVQNHSTCSTTLCGPFSDFTISCHSTAFAWIFASDSHFLTASPSSFTVSRVSCFFSNPTPEPNRFRKYAWSHWSKKIG